MMLLPSSRRCYLLLLLQNRSMNGVSSAYSTRASSSGYVAADLVKTGSSMQGFGQIQTVYTSSSMPVTSYSQVFRVCVWGTVKLICLQTSGLPIIQQYTRPVQVVEMHPVEMHPVQIVDMSSPPPPQSPKIIEKIVSVPSSHFRTFHLK